MTREPCAYCGQEERYGHNAICVMNVVEELRAENERLQGHMRALADTSVARDTAGIFKGLWQGSERECEELRAEIARLGSLATIVREQGFEIERLRAALESLTKDPPATLDEPDTDCEVVIKMRTIARAALEPKP